MPRCHATISITTSILFIVATTKSNVRFAATSYYYEIKINVLKVRSCMLCVVAWWVVALYVTQANMLTIYDLFLRLFYDIDV
jgi:hypothetical protein